MQRAQEDAQAAHAAAEGLSWDNAEHTARLEAAEQAQQAWHTLAYVHQQMFGTAGTLSITRPAHLPTPAPRAPRPAHEVVEFDPGDEADRL